MSLSLRKIFSIFGLTTVFAMAPVESEAMYTSVKSLGMAGAVAAHPLDSLVAAYNPGGLGFAGDRWDLGVHGVYMWGQTEYIDNPLVEGRFNSHYGSEYVCLPEFGINKYTCNDLFTWGFVIYNKSFLKTNYKFPNPLYGDTKLGLEYAHYVASITGSVIIADDHCIGLTLDYHGQRLMINGLQNFETHPFSRHPKSVSNKGYDYSGGFGGTVGWMGKVSHCVRLGVAYSPKVRMSRFRDYKGLVATGGRLDIPQRVVGGVAIRMLNDLTATFDIEHVNYNYIKPLHDSLHLVHHDGEEFHHHKKRLGGEKGSGLGWMDQTVFRLGLDWDLSPNYSFRCGYWYQRTPIHASQTYANALTPYLAQRIATWGGSWKNACNEFSFYGAYAFKNHKNGRHSIPVGFGGGEVNLKEDQWMAGFSWGRFF